MPVLYLSASLQETGLYIGTGGQTHIANLIFNAMLPFLQSSGIQYVHGASAGTVDPPGRGIFGLHLILQTKLIRPTYEEAAEEISIYYYPGSANSQHAAYVITKNMKSIYYNPAQVKILSTTSIAQLREAKVPTVYIKADSFDRPRELRWMQKNLTDVARNLVQSAAEYFGIPFIPPQPERPGVVAANTGVLNIRSKPNTTASILAQARKGQKLKILGKWKNWFVVSYNGVTGYAKSEFIKILVSD